MTILQYRQRFSEGDLGLVEASAAKIRTAQLDLRWSDEGTADGACNITCRYIV
jgi:hypothetical protein